MLPVDHLAVTRYPAAFTSHKQEVELTTQIVSMILNLMTAACGVLMIMAQGLSLSSLLYAVSGIILFLVGKGIWKRVINIAGANRPAT